MAWYQMCCYIANGMPLAWVDTIRYLSVFIRSWKFKYSSDNAKCSFLRSVNALFSKIERSASEDVFLHSVYSKCLPILLYGVEVCQLNKSDLWSLDFTETCFLMKMFWTSSNDVINECRCYFNFKLSSEILPARYDQFIFKLNVVRPLIKCTLSCHSTVVFLSMLASLSTLVLWTLILLFNYYYYCFIVATMMMVNKDYHKLFSIILLHFRLII